MPHRCARKAIRMLLRWVRDAWRVGAAAPLVGAATARILPFQFTVTRTTRFIGNVPVTVLWMNTTTS